MTATEKKSHGKITGRKIYTIITLSIIIFSAPFLANLVADKYAVSKINKILEILKSDCYGLYDNAGYGISSKTLTLTNFAVICLEEEAAIFGTVKITDVVINNNLPTSLAADFDNAVINADAKIFDSLAGIASKIGLDAVRNRGKVEYKSNNNETAISFTINADNLGVAIGQIKLVNLNINNETNPKIIIEKLFDSKNISFAVTFKDNGLLNNAMEKYAQALGVGNSIKAKDRALNGLEKRIYTEGKTKPETAAKLEEFYKFIQNPNELTITASQEDNLSLREIYSSLDYSGWRNFIASLKNFKPSLKTK